MKVIRRRKCKSCKKLFSPERRNAWHQEYCSKEECRRASKAASQRRWLKQPCNRDYFRGPENVARVREWRAAHPGYWRKQDALQEVIMSQHADINLENGTFAECRRVAAVQELLPLQEVVANQPLIIVGLIANLTGATLQDDIVAASRNLLRLGRDVMGGGAHDGKANTGAKAPAASAAAVQLGGSSAAVG